MIAHLAPDSRFANDKSVADLRPSLTHKLIASRIGKTPTFKPRLPRKNKKGNQQARLKAINFRCHLTKFFDRCSYVSLC